LGLLYLWELPFLFIGLYMILFGTFQTKTKIILLTWFLLAPIPASVTTVVPHAIRTLNFLPLFQIFTALGVMTSWKKISGFKFSYGISVLLILVFIFNFTYYLDQYFVQQNYYNSEEWQYGYEKAVPFVQSTEKKYKKIIVDNKPYMDQSYIFFLFYLQYPPAKYQEEN